MSKRTVQFSIYRYDPDKDDAPYMQDISVELEPTDRKLLDALTKLNRITSYNVCYTKLLRVVFLASVGWRDLRC